MQSSRLGAPPRPSSKPRSSASDLLRQLETAASDMTASQRAQMMRILAGDTHLVMTVEERDSAEGQYAKMRSNAKGLQERCDELATINREKTSRMEGITNAKAALAAQVSDMRQDVITAQHGKTALSAGPSSLRLPRRPSRNP